jgi:hypothetical protein
MDFYYKVVDWYGRKIIIGPFATFEEAEDDPSYSNARSKEIFIVEAKGLM